MLLFFKGGENDEKDIENYVPWTDSSNESRDLISLA